MTHSTCAERAACIDQPALFHHPLLEATPARPDVEGQRKATLLKARAGIVCAQCPLFRSCLYQAVVAHDVSGFVAGTTESQRGRIRAALGVTVKQEDFDSLAGVTGGGRQINHDEVVRLRQANPHESLDVLARRLGCSLSTVKRHMRQSRNTPAEVRLAVAEPTIEGVLTVFAAVVGLPRAREQRVA